MEIRRLLATLLFGLAPLLAGASAGNAAEARQENFGTTPDGHPVIAITLTNGSKLQVRVISLGATLQSLRAPDRNGRIDDVVLGYSDLKGYLANSSYFGATVGRFANRVAKGRFTLDGKLSASDQQWRQQPARRHRGLRTRCCGRSSDVKSGPEASVTLRYVSPDGDQGYPGQLTVDRDLFAQRAQRTDDRLSGDHRQADHRQPVQPRLLEPGGRGLGRSILDQLLTIPADAYTPVDDTQIPTGEMRAGRRHAFRFPASPSAIGRDIRDGRDKQIADRPGLRP